ncbi:DUF7289 family protein [Halovivax gelatinilyticus]|uniref:DUF7289 family protein n=1 Tax=Halovivax gelatinilyticus TaxID=2961597 RepID=UPI0020CA9AB5|nr:hypothetical protein [Halovivax gelatinilyticus]
MLRAGDGMTSADRAVTPIVGGILIIGLVSVTALGVLAVSLDVVANTQQEAETERAQSSLVELTHTMNTVGNQADGTGSVDLDVGEGGAIIRDDTGSVTIDYDNVSAEFEDTITFGAIEYEANDGSLIAVEAGAVFRGTGEASQLVSGPSITYDNETNTLNFPILEAVGDEQLRDDRITVRSADVASQSDVVENEEVVIEIESKYWGGWEEYFLREVGERGVIAYDNEGEDTGTVEVNLGRIDTPTPFENAVTVRDEIELDGNANVTGSAVDGSEIDPIDDEIDEMVESARENYTELTDPEGPIEAGEYYVDGSLTIDEPTVVDLTDGDVTLVVDGDINVDQEFRVTNWGDNELQIYTTGDLTIEDQMCLDETECEGAHSDRGGNNQHEPDAINPSQLQVYGTSSFELDMSGGTYFEGVIYAPAGEDGTSKYVENGNAYIDGSLVIGSVEAGGTPTIHHHDELKWTDPDIGDPVQPPELTYLNLVYKELGVGHE